MIPIRPPMHTLVPRLVSFLLVVAIPLHAQDDPYPMPDALLAASREAVLPLELGWADPPLLARTRCWWWWLNGNVTKAAITRDLEEMKAKGFGGANIIDAGGADQRGNRQVPHGPDFGSPAWRELFVHALAEADRLELELGFNIVSGWNLGGPTVTPEQAAKRLTFSEVTVEGGGAVEVELAMPQHRDGFYRDVAVVAFPTVRGGAIGATITASSEQAAHPAARAFDEDPATFWVSEDGGPTDARPARLTVVLSARARIDAVEIVPRPRYGPRRGVVEARIDGTWQHVASLEGSQHVPTVVRFAAVEADALRLTVTDSFDPSQPDAPRNVQVAELIVRDGDTVVAGGRGRGRIRHFAEKAYYRYPGSFTGTEAWHLLEIDDERPGDVACRARDVVEISDRMGADGALAWDAPPGSWCVLRIGYTISGAQVSTHSEGWSGLAIDYLDRAAFEGYWRDVVEPILADAGQYVGRSLRFLHTDSWELGPVNWTARMPAAFRERRGYDMTPFLPVLADHVVDSRDASTRFLEDFRRTLAELIADSKYRTFDEHADRLGMAIHPESGGPHAAPIDALLNLGVGDVPMGEFWARSKTHRVADHQRLFVKQTSSAANVYGRRIALAEAFTTIGPHWQRDPARLKPTFDRAACEGHNLTMWHSFDCSPEEMGVPGQAYFAGTHLNPNVTWWPQAGAFVGYLNRCHFLLQQGLMVCDVLHFYGENIPSFVRLKRDDPAGVLPGYDYDVIDKAALLSRVRVGEDGLLGLPEGKTYRLLSLTPHDAIGLESLRAIAALVDGGARVVGRRPERRFGLGGGDAADREFEALVERLWGEGRVIAGQTAREVLQADGVPLDFEHGDGGVFLDYLHRRTDDADLYFVVNRLDAAAVTDARFRVRGRRPEFWDPITGERRPATMFRQEGEVTVVPLQLPAEGSVFVVFRQAIDADASGAGPSNFPRYEPVQTIGGPWTVRFDPAWGGRERVTFDALVDWSTHQDPAIRFYSGAADYEATFRWDAEDGPVVLDLGDLRNLAEVRLNGRDLGVVWCRPYRVALGDALRPGENRLQVRAVNLWANRVIGDASLPVDQRRTRTNITALKAGTPLEPSGLFGPVRLLRAR